MKVKAIVAMDKNRVIGYEGKIPWYHPEDLKRFKALTMGKFAETQRRNAVIMGRKTWDSLPGVLKGRYNIVLTRNIRFVARGGLCVNFLEDALDIARMLKCPEAWIIGGGEIYKRALQSDVLDRIEITEIKGEHEGDAYFPELDVDDWSMDSVQAGPGGLAYKAWNWRGLAKR